ncbi:response regulator [Baaleninema sp.]|uniref:response regulator n=1 Tax=Baaleninema sp. TaxID=3101197 RepID=UPI003D060EF6
MRKILVIDDKWENRAVLKHILTPLGFEIIEAENGKEGVTQAVAESPDLIVTDLVMPELDGFETIRHLREMPQFQRIPIVVSSASVFESDRNRSLDLGGSDFLPKPVQVEDLLCKLQKLLQLEWIYLDIPTREKVDRTSDEATEEEDIVPPPLSELEVLLDSAKRGSLRKLKKQVDALASENPQYAPFARKIGELVKGFQEREVLKLLETYYESGSNA